MTEDMSSKSAPIKTISKVNIVKELITNPQLQLKKLMNPPSMSKALMQFNSKIGKEKELKNVGTSSKENVSTSPLKCECGKRLALGTTRCLEPCIVVRESKKKFGMRRPKVLPKPKVGILKPKIDLDE